MVPASGGDWGGICVDKAFQKFLTELFGEDVMKMFKSHPDYIEDYFDFWQTFEIKKRSFDLNKPKQEEKENDKSKEETEKDEMFLIRLPVALAEIVGKQTQRDFKVNRSDVIFQEVIEKSSFKNDLKCEHGKLQMKCSFFKRMFDPTVKMLSDHLAKLLKTIEDDLKVILMVGGFSECSVVHNAIRAKFQDKCRVVIPNQAGLAVLKGAVYFGHQPDLISERVARYTYGIQAWPKFDKRLHLESKKVVMGNEHRCKDAFFRFVAKGERIKPGDKRSHLFQALKPGEPSLECGVFISNEESPKYIDEKGCIKLGELSVPLSSNAKEIEESLIFGHTELLVTACNCQNKKEYKVTFDLLSEKINFPEQ